MCPLADRRLLAASTIQGLAISNFTPSFSLRVLSPRFHDLFHVPSGSEGPDSLSTLRASGVLDSYAVISPEVISPKLHGFPPCVPL
jgi:hypothetical protein